jgi:uncharacterized membrane protein (DUF485 family)
MVKPAIMSNHVDHVRNADQDRALLGRVMRRQVRLSLGVASVFLGIVLLLPIFNLYFPNLAAQKVGGFTLTWLILGVLFYPITWGLSALFIRQSNALEDAIERDEKSGVAR